MKNRLLKTVLLVGTLLALVVIPVYPANAAGGTLKICKYIFNSESVDTTFEIYFGSEHADITVPAGELFACIEIEVTPGTPSPYNISENVPNGWFVANINCKLENESSTGTVNPTGNGVENITVQNGKTTVCDIHNDHVDDKYAVLQICKIAKGGDGDFIFNIDGNSIGGIEYLATVATAGGYGCKTIYNLSGGIYNVTEKVPNGWNLDGVVCYYDGVVLPPPVPPVGIHNAHVTKCVFTDSKKSGGQLDQNPISTINQNASPEENIDTENLVGDPVTNVLQMLAGSLLSAFAGLRLRR